MKDTHYLARALRAAYLGMHRASDAHFASHGVTADQFVLLAALAEESAVTQQELVRRASSDPSTVRAMLVLLEKRGLVTRERNSADGRARSVRLTDVGRDVFNQLWMTSRPILGQLLEGFKQEETQMLLAFLRRMIENMVPVEKSRELVSLEGR